MNFTLTKVNKQLILLVSGVFLLGGSVYADVYKWKNTKGIMQYSDSPPSAITQKPSQRILLSILKTQDYCANVPTKAKSNVGNADILANFFSPVTNTVKAVSPSFSIGNWNTGQTATSTLTTNTRLTTTTTVAPRVFGSFGFNTISPSTPFGVQRSSLGTFGFGVQATAPTTTTFLAATKPTTAITTAVPVVSATATSVSGTNFMPTIDLSKVPLSKSGAFNRVLTTMPLPSVGDGDGQFRTVCGMSHMNNDDPIIFPGVKGATHHHTFFGNTGANFSATPDNIFSSGNSTCAGGIANRSAYWVPTMVNTKTNTPLTPHDMVLYYKTGYIVPKEYITVPPKGLRMITGNSKSASEIPSDNPQAIGFRCFSNTAATTGAHHVLACSKGNALRVDISFPQCWDGKNLDSPDHKSHMAYASYDYKTVNKCPTSHPIAIPKISVLVDYDVTELSGTSGWRLASDNYSTTLPAGYSFHSDWMNGWDEAIMTKVVKNCLNAGKECNGNLGDGTGLDNAVAYK